MELVVVTGIFAVVIGLAVLAQSRGWIDMSNRRYRERRSVGGGIVGIGDEVFNPTRHEARLEQDRQTLLPAPAPLAGDFDKDVYQGKVRIEVDGCENLGRDLSGS